MVFRCNNEVIMKGIAMFTPVLKCVPEKMSKEGLMFRRQKDLCLDRTELR